MYVYLTSIYINLEKKQFWVVHKAYICMLSKQMVVLNQNKGKLRNKKPQTHFNWLIEHDIREDRYEKREQPFFLSKFPETQTIQEREETSNKGSEDAQ